MKLEEFLNTKFETKEEMSAAASDLDYQDFDMNIDVETLPDFMQLILTTGGVGRQGAINFMGKFGIYYLQNEQFRNLMKDCTFLFVNHDYEGVYFKEETLGRRNITPKFPPLFIDMNPFFA